MSMDLSTLATNADKLEECIDKNEKREQDRKNEQLYGAIERKVKKEKHRREKPKSRDGTIKECIRLFKEGASPEVLAELEKSLRGQEKYYKYYVQCFLPVLGKKISRELNFIKQEEIGRVISGITGKNNDQNHYNRRNSEDSGVGSDSDDDHKYQTNDTEPKNGEIFSVCADEDINDCLLEAAKRGNKKKIKKLVQKGADISAKDGNNNNALHHIISPKDKQIASFEGKRKVTCLKLILKLSQNNTSLKAQLREAVNAKNQEGKTPLQKLLFSKITKEEHSSEGVSGKIVKSLTKPFTDYDDNTIEAAITLFELGANVDDFKLSDEELQNLEEYRKYYLKFLEKLAESVKQSKLDQETKNLVVIKIAEITDGGYPLHKAVSDKNINRFNELLQSGYDITTEDAEKNTVLHYAVKLNGEAKCDFTKLILEKNKELVNTPNREQQISLHQLLQRIKEKSKKSSLGNKIQNIVKKEFKTTCQTLELLLQNGADITAQDKEGRNALHYIASLKGGQKVACLELILRLVKEKEIPEDQLSRAINAANGEEDTPLRLALKKKAKKGNIEYLSQETIFDPAINYDNTTKFCAALLQNGANQDSLWLKDPEFHTKKYYLILRDLKDYSRTPQKAQEKARETKKQLEKKYNIKTFSGQLQSTAQNVGSSIKKGASATGKIFSAVAKYIDPASRTRELLAITITVTVIAMAAFAFFQGQVRIGAAIPIIAVAGAICLTLTLGFSGIKKLFENSTNEAKNLINNDQQNSAKSSEEQIDNPPDTKMNDTRSEPHKESHSVTNTLSSLAR